MKNLINVITTIMLAFAFTGCAYKAQVLSTSAPVAEIQPDKQIDCTASYFIESEIRDLAKDIKPSSYVCRVHTFPLEVGTALKSSIVKVLEGTFANVTTASSKTPSESDGRYKFIFSLDTFHPTLRFSQGFWQANIFANTEIVMKVMVTDANGKEVVRTTISGEGSADTGGLCGDGAQVLADATQKAIKRTLENLVYKIINSDYLASNPVKSIEGSMK